MPLAAMHVAVTVHGMTTFDDFVSAVERLLALPRHEQEDYLGTRFGSAAAVADG